MAKWHDDQPIGKHARHAAPSSDSAAGAGNAPEQGSTANAGRQQPVQQPSAQQQPQYQPVDVSAYSRYSAAGNYSASANSYDSNSNAAYPGADSVCPSGDYGYGETVYRVRRKKKKKKAPIIVASVLAAVLVLCCVFGALLFKSATSAKDDASSIMANMDLLQSSIAEGDYASASSTANSMQTAAANMNSELHSPVWAIASVLPVVGSDVQGVQTVAEVLDTLSSQALVPLTTSLRNAPIDELVGEDGTINLESMNSLLAVVEQTSPVMQECADKMDAVPTMNISQLENVMGPAKEKFASINDMYQQGATFAPIMAKMLGAQGDRSYLVVAQNSAEIRSTGGFPGSMGLLTVSNGKISLGSFGTPYDLLADSTSLVTDSEKSLFGLGYVDVSVPRDSGVIPDFTDTAEIWAQAYTAKTGSTVDGVISVTPSVVQDLLGISGGITLTDGTTLDGSNATKVLESDLYWKYLSADSSYSNGADITDALFAEAAGLAFDKVVSGMGSGMLMDMAGVFSEDMANGTLMMWLSSSSEQSQIAPLDCSGALSTDAANPETGVFVGLITGSKLGWYYDVDTSIGHGTKNADGTTSYSVTVTLHNGISSSEAKQAGTYIAGVYDGAVDPIMYFTAPAGGSISGISSSGACEFAEGEFEGLQVFGAHSMLIQPGASQTITYTATSSADAEGDLKLQQTPTLTQYRNAA